MDVRDYITSLNKHLKSGHATEHTYRGDFAELLKCLVTSIHVTNEPSKVTDCGNPDYVITKKNIPVGFIEAKNIGSDLNGKQYKEQFTRYRKALDNLIITDYVWFQFFENGEKVHEVRIAEMNNNELQFLPNNFDYFKTLIINFCSFVAQTIKSPRNLAKMMAAKARLVENILEKAISFDEEHKNDSELRQQYETFKSILIHDLTPKGFADIYAQTLAYGMFAARLHDKTLKTFSRQEAAELIPKSNPFLRKLFAHVAGVDIDERIEKTVDNLADVFRATNVEAILSNFGKATQTQDPIIHFYETFLAEYDPKMRKTRGVWYTPEPIVNFIVRGVDGLLKNEFNIDSGIADTRKTTIQTQLQGTAVTKGRGKGRLLVENKDVHKVQILDPATGTGTFLSEVVKYIYTNEFESVKGAWSSYVENDLIPRLNGFEILMASYSMAHLKLDMLLTQTGYEPKSNSRFNIYLTNSLEEHHPDTGTLFSTWLSQEANEANYVKRDTPVMAIMGNPPYSGESVNKGEWITELMEEYKKEPGGKEKLKEKNSKWINDDYVKFIRFSQYFIEKNGEGVVAFINPHGFLDNPTFRGMRWSLLKTFDKIYTIDLHGNNKKKEVSPDGTPDVNVFDIEQGVSINFFVKSGDNDGKALGKVFHYDIFGKRDKKYQELLRTSLDELPFTELETKAPMYYFVPKDYKLLEKYEKSPSLDDIFILSGNGVVTKRDNLCIQDSKDSCFQSAKDIIELEKEVFYKKYKLPNDVRDWKYEWAKKDILENGCDVDKVKEISYRPFDTKYIYYTGRSRGFVGWPVDKVMSHYIRGENIGLLAPKAFKDSRFNHAFVTKNISEAIFLSSLSGSNAMNFPLYVYDQASGVRHSNINTNILDRYESILGMNFSDGITDDNNFSSFDVFKYIYATLHSPSYKNEFNEPLKTGFPRVPFPNSKEMFFRLSKLGALLIDAHLCRNIKNNGNVPDYPVSGSNKVTKRVNASSFEIIDDDDNKLGRVWINEEQYFDKVSLVAWNLFVGGYQPAQKWLKDRFGKILSYEEVKYYQMIISSLIETDRISQEIDSIPL